jgi:uncharacterized protein YdeI (YjbR/CyaY-like superfamily)
MEPTYFPTAAEFREWLAKHAESSAELVVGFMKRASGSPSITWPEAVDEALCVGWIDGVRHRIDDERYKIRFTPRKGLSTWSAVNIERVAVLQAEGRLNPAGLAAFERRTEKRSRTYAYEQPVLTSLNAEEVKRFKKNMRAWTFFEAQAPSYRTKAIWRVVSAKQWVTRERRLSLLVEASAAEKRL